MVDPGSIKPVFGITGLPPGRGAGPEIRDDMLVSTLESLGARLAWTRASICPCEGINDQTQQPDPLCTMCSGYGTFYFGPQDYEKSAAVGDLTPLQQLIINRSGAAVIRGAIQRVTQAQEFYDVLGNWARGTMMVTVRSENKLGYYDRLVNIDSEVAYSQKVVVGATPTANIVLRYPAISINNVQAAPVAGSTRYAQGTDFVAVNGELEWVAGRGPATGARLSVHYLMHPTWLVADVPHVLRESARRRDHKPQTTPLGNPTPLPLQASVRLEFLPTHGLPAAVPV